jgi:acetolactate synthase-1/2/3 large subunit
VRQHIPILTVVLNNFCMTVEIKNFPAAVEKYRCADISGNYAEFAKALGGYSERVTQPGEIIPAVKRAIRKTEEGIPALLEFLTAKEALYPFFK